MNSSLQDTIAAQATPPGEGAISVVRLSGPASLPILDGLFRGATLPSKAPPRTFLHGRILDAEGSPLDDVLVLVFRAPKSYTGEDAAEIHCHGNPCIVRAVLDALFQSGARLAGPGEFTKRAFLNGKMNLTQAEAVMDLIRARSDRAVRLAADQLHDALGSGISALYAELVSLTADTEAMLDFPDDELPQEVPDSVLARARAIQSRLSALLSSWNEGRVLREGLSIALVGAPNTGKSTLLNRLSGRDRAIVSPIPGTTRDVLEADAVLDGFLVRFLDTAGLRETADAIEREGIARTHRALESADLCLCLVDASRPLSPEETAFIARQPADRTLVLANKTDLGDLSPTFPLAPHRPLPLSLKNDRDLSPLIEAILAKADLSETAENKGQTGDFQGHVAVSERHKILLQAAGREVARSVALLEARREDQYLPAASCFRAALEPLAEILGKDFREDTLDSVFSHFCIGK